MILPILRKAATIPEDSPCGYRNWEPQRLVKNIVKHCRAMLSVAIWGLSCGMAWSGDDSAFIAGQVQHISEPAIELADSLWQWAEVGYQEHKSSAQMQQMLADAGFAVESEVAGISTAFVASYGSKGPVIALLAEMDALPGASQAAVPEKSPLAGKQAGHACGHHLFGAGSVAAAIAVKGWLEANKMRGQVRLYGTPAEEGGSGKVYLVRAGLFDDVDVVLHWHPGDRNSASAFTSLANKSAKFRFSGVASHAAVAPEHGRSALDGVEAMNNMVNMLREHVPSDTRIHYVITHGGEAPNVVPEYAEVFYYARSPSAEQLMSIWARVEKAAQGAALGTGTKVEWEVIHGAYNLLPNIALAAVMHSSLAGFGGLSYTPEEQTFADKIQVTLGARAKDRKGTEQQIEPFVNDVILNPGSTDVGDVSWMVPTVGLSTATWVPGTPPHSWQAVAAGGMSIGHKGMLLAAKTLAQTAVELFRDPSLIEAARKEFDERRGEEFQYQALVGDREPPLDYRKKSLDAL